MKKSFIFLVVVSLICTAAVKVFAVDNAVVVSIKGQASLMKAGVGGWAVALEGQPIEEKDSVKTGGGSALNIGFADGSMISIDENSEGSIEKLRFNIEEDLYQGEVKLSIGQVIAKIQKFKNKNSSFGISSPSAVTAVRGTEFIVNVNQAGETKVAVFDGEVGMAGYTKDGQVAENEVSVQENQEASVAGAGEAPTEPVEMSPEMASQAGKVEKLAEKADEHKNKVEEQKKQEKEEEKKEKKEKKKKKKEKKKEKKEKDKKDKEKEGKKDKEGDTRTAQESEEEIDIMAELRDEMREFVDEIKIDINEKQEIVDEVEESDFAEGKMLRDIHGNLVEVRQYLQRPAADVVHFINLVKRSGYEYKGDTITDSFLPYSGTSSPRLDSLEAKIKFGQDIPREVSEWPSTFMGEDSEGFSVDNSEFVFSNNNTRLTMKMKDEDSFSAYEGGDDDEGSGMAEMMPELMYIERKDKETGEWGEKAYIGSAAVEVDGEPTALMDPEDIALDGFDLESDSMSEAVKVWGGINVGLYSQKPEEPGEEVSAGYFDDNGYLETTNIKFGVFGIDDSGNIKGSLDFFDPENIDPFAMLDTLDGLAGELIVQSDYFYDEINDPLGNIDLIVAPDTFLSIAEELLPAIPDLIQ